MRIAKSALLSLCISGLFAFTVAHANGPIDANGNGDLKPSGKGWGEGQAFSKPDNNGKPVGGGGNTNGINYHGGPVILGTTHVYYIWYGNSGWPTNSANSILTNLAQNIGGSPYFNINTTYYDSTNTHVTNAVSYNGSTTHAETYGTALSDNQIEQIVSDTNPTDSNAVYFVLTGPDVTASSGFCTRYCGWHTHATIGGRDIKYAFVGDAASQCPSSCTAQSTSPNGDIGADGMASVISHELEEAVSDPDLNAWYDRRGQENADKCAWTFGTEYTVSNGSKANMRLGSLDYLIQRNWVNAGGGYCALNY